MLKLWGRSSSINVQKVMWTLAEIGLEYEQVDVGGRFGGLESPAFRALNPHGRIPVLEDAGRAIWESNAIVRYLSERYGAGELAPQDPISRAQCDQWMDWSATVLQPAFIGFFWSWYRTPEGQRNDAAARSQLTQSHQAFATLGQALGERMFMAGDRLTMADIPAAALLYRYFTLDIDRPSLPRMEAYYARLCEREPYRRAVMIAYDELKGQTGS